MAPATEAPASVTAEGPTSHTQNQVSRFTAPQLRLLHRQLDPKRIGKDDKGFAHMQAWDIKRYLLRVFGFAGYDTENRELALLREIETPNGNRSKWTVVYRAQVRLTVKDVHGNVLGYWDGEAAGAGNNLPNLADSHDMAMKTATSQAFKRAATHLGDAFGLSLYNNGSPQPVVQFSAAHPPEQWEKVAAPLPEPEDPPVLPEQDAKPADEEPAPAATASRPRGMSPAETQQQVLGPFLERVRNGWDTLEATLQALAEAKAKALLNEMVPFGEPKVPTRVEDMLNARIKQLRARRDERNGHADTHERSAA
ncbi:MULTISPECIES: Rad52/Rad22 family DNA repair protein [unclassified Streptomyces]|uniref:Rad52/Rad22 family DNA repair protein n=1 Tax=unclassified Streptomyces TaxID=2593676 RepID=UPI00068BD60F|nr:MULTISPECIES: Rad52/Rad22 family DNA repair protein [unclassified Streptomyces]